MASEALRTLIGRWRDDPGANYKAWFLWEERIKNFRSIRRGLAVSPLPCRTPPNTDPSGVM